MFRDRLLVRLNNMGQCQLRQDIRRHRTRGAVSQCVRIRAISAPIGALIHLLLPAEERV